MMPDPTGIAALDQVLVWGGVASVVLAVCTGLWRVGRVLVRLVRGVELYLSDWYGEPERPGVPARPGVLVRLQRAEEAVVRIGGRLGRMEQVLARLRPEGEVRPDGPSPGRPEPGN